MSDVVTLPRLLPLDERGVVVADDDLVGQYRRCLERAGELLADEGLDLSHAVSTIDFSTAATRNRYPKIGRARKELLGPVYPGAAGILLDDLGVPGALCALDVVASRAPLRVVNPGWSRYDTLTYNPGVAAGDTLFMSGFGALDLHTQEALHDGDLYAQTVVTYEAILETMAVVGATPADLTGLVEYLCPEAIGHEDVVAAARAEVLGTDTIEPVQLPCAGLLRPEFLIEIVPTARIPQGAR